MSSSSRRWSFVFVCLVALAAAPAFAEESESQAKDSLMRGSGQEPAATQPESEVPSAPSGRPSAPAPPWNDIQTILFHPPAIA